MFKNHRKDHAPKSNFHMTNKIEKIHPEPCHGENFKARHSFKTGTATFHVYSNHERIIRSRATKLNISVDEYKRRFILNSL
jgi:hypothetical protein